MRDFERVIVTAEAAELRDQSQVIDTISRGHIFRMKKSKSDRHCVRRKGKSVWTNRADTIPFDRGIDYFTAAIQENPTAIDYTMRGLLRYENGDLDGALNDYDEGIHLDPKLAQAWAT